MKRALKVVGGLVVLVLLVLAGFASRQWWLRRERDQLLREEAVRAPVARPTAYQVQPGVVPSAQPACVTGVVLEGRKPVANAQVSAAPWVTTLATGCPCGAGTACDCPAGLQWQLDTLQGGAGLVDGEEGATTDAQGHFALCGPVHARKVWAETADGRLGFADAMVTTASGEAPVIIEVAAPQRVEGRVVEEGPGTPLAGAQVLVKTMPAVRSARAVADAEGRFSVLAPPGSLMLVAGAPGFVPHMQGVAARTPTQVALSRPATAFVQVLRAGVPVPGAQVRFNRSQQAVAGPDGVAVFAGVPRTGNIPLLARKGTLVGVSTVAVTGAELHAFVELDEGSVLSGTLSRKDGGPVTPALVTLSGTVAEKLDVDAEGHFTSPPVPRGPWTLRASLEGCAGQVEDDLQLRPGPTTHDLVVDCEPSLEGTVTDARGQPVNAATLSMKLGRRFALTETNSLGAFRAVVPPGPLTLTVEAKGYRKATVDVTVPATQVHVVLDAGGTVSGRVVDAEGKPQPDVRVMMLPVLLEDLLSQRGEDEEVTTGEDGRFVFGGRLPGRFRVAAATGEGTGQSAEVLLPPGGTVEGVEVRLGGHAPVTGTVRDARGHAIVGAGVNLSIINEKAELSRVVSALARGDMTQLLSVMGTEAHTDLDGHFTLRPSFDAALRLRVTASGHRAFEQPVQTGATVAVVLEDVAQRTVRGRVVDARGPLTAFVVQGDAQASPDGRFTREVFEYDQTLTFSAPGHARASRPVGKDVEDLGDVLLAEGVPLEVVVRDEAGAPVASASVSAKQGEARVGGSTGAEGLTVLQGLAEGSARLEVNAPGFLAASQDATVAATSPRVEVSLRRARGGIAGTVRNAQGPWAGATLELRPDWTQARTTADGAFHFESLAPRRYSVFLRSQGNGWGARVDVGEAPTTLDFDLTTGALEGEARVGGDKVTGGVVVALSGGAPKLPGTALLDPGEDVLGEANRVVWATVRDGRFVMEGLPPGRWALYLVRLVDLADEAVAPVMSVDVPAGGRQRVDLAR